MTDYFDLLLDYTTENQLTALEDEHKNEIELPSARKKNIISWCLCGRDDKTETICRLLSVGVRESSTTCCWCATTDERALLQNAFALLKEPSRWSVVPFHAH